MWQYKAELIRVIDGDTIDVKIDLGFRNYCVQRLRLTGVDTPEKVDEGWAAATQFTKDFLNGAKYLIIETEKSDSFGRYLAKVTPVDEEDGVVMGCLNDALLSSGNAVVYSR